MSDFFEIVEDQTGDTVKLASFANDVVGVGEVHTQALMVLTLSDLEELEG